MGPLNIVLQDDVSVRGGAQLWLMDFGKRLQTAGHNVTFILPQTSLMLEDFLNIRGASITTYDSEAIAVEPTRFTRPFTAILKSADVCIALVRQQRGKFQNVNFIANCIADAGLNTYLIAKTGTPDPTYRRNFYGGPLLDKGQASIVTIAEYTKSFVAQKMGIPAKLITNIYNGTDITRTPQIALESIKPFPRSESAYTVGCIGSFEKRKAQSLLLLAAKKLIEDRSLPNVFCLLVGEGPDREMLADMIEELDLQNNARLCEFTKEPLSVIERCDLIALPSTGKEGLPNVLLEALALEKPCVATRSFGIPEVVLDGQTGYCFPAGNVDAFAKSILRVANLSDEEARRMAVNCRELAITNHDKARQFDTFLTYIKEKVALRSGPVAKPARQLNIRGPLHRLHY